MTSLLSLADASWRLLQVATTPEKFDAITRKLNAAGGARFFGDIALVLIDEV